MFKRSHRNYQPNAASLTLLWLVLLIQAFFLATPALAQTSGKELLKNGIQQYDNAEFELAVVTLQQAIQTNLKEKDDIIQAHKYLAFSYAAMGDEQKAKLEFLKLLEIYPIFDLLLSESPKLRQPFELAKQEYVPKDTAPPAINFAPPAAVNENTAIPVSATVTDASGVESVLLFYKKASDKTFIELPLIKGQRDSYSGTIPAEVVSIAGIEYYIQAKDKAGNEPALVGSAQKPLKIMVNLVDQDPPVIVHTPISSSQENSDILIEARISDRTGVKLAELFYRKAGATPFTTEKLEPKSDNMYQAKIPARAVSEAGVEYYLRTVDVTNPPALAGSAENPFKIVVSIIDRQSPEIEHAPIATASENTPIKISAAITDRSGVAEATLFYRRTDAKEYTRMKMQQTGENQYLAEIPGVAVTPAGLTYYIHAVDALQNPPAYKGTAEKPLFIKVTRVDLEPPTIAHTPVQEAREGEKVELTAAVIDNVGVAEVKLFYRTKGITEYRSEQMRREKESTYSTTISAQAEGIEYYIMAQDISSNPPSLWKNANDPQLMVVKAKDASVQLAKKGSKKWLWIGLGAAAVGGGVAVAALLGGENGNKPPGGDSKLPNPPTTP